MVLKKLNKKSMKNLLVALGVLSVTAISFISCTKTDENVQPNQSEIQSRRHTSGGSGGSSSVQQVTGLSVTVSSSTQVNLTWTSVPNAQGYWIYRTTSGNEYVPAVVQSTNYVDAALSPGTTYTYAVAAVVSTVLGPKSVSVTVTTPQ
jgi:fibronectin type 3 domain-containing protein